MIKIYKDNDVKKKQEKNVKCCLLYLTKISVSKSLITWFALIPSFVRYKGTKQVFQRTHGSHVKAGQWKCHEQTDG